MPTALTSNINPANSHENSNSVAGQNNIFSNTGILGVLNRGVLVYTVLSSISSINAERLTEALPPQIQFQVSLQMPSSQPYRRDEAVVVPFALTISTTPPVVHISLKGQAMVVPRSDEGRKLCDQIISDKRVPAQFIQTAFMNVLADVIIISRALGVPPPLPPLFQQAVQQVSEREQRYSPIQ